MNVFTRTFNAIGGRLLVRSGRAGILATTGRRTGRHRATPVGYLARADGTVLLGAGGPGRAWVSNLRAHPACTFTIRGVETRHRARELEGAERDAAIAELRAKMGGVAERAAWAEVFELSPEA